jgi:NADPH2:quinone reductase
MGQAIWVSRHGGPEVLELREYDPGEPDASQALVRVEAAGVNFIDTYLRSGAYSRPTPFVLGFEGAGVVERVVGGAGEFPLGARVAWAQVPGSYATHLLAPLTALIRIPDDVSSESAAAAMLQGLTAHYLVHGVRQTAPGDTALVHAAAGGTGRLLVQMLRTAGARVIATCSSDAKERLAREAGAEEVIRYDRSEFAPAVRRWTSGRGVDVVYDSVGQATFDASLASLRPRGLCVLFGQSSGAVPPFDLQRLNQAGSVFVTRPSLAHYVASREEYELRAGAVLAALGDRRLSLQISGRFALSDAAAAHRLLESRDNAGKLLLL